MSEPQATERLSLTGSCFCGSLSYEVKGEPVLAAYCHCTGCQRLTGCPFIHTVHYTPEAFSWTRENPESNIDKFIPPEKPWKSRIRCKNCGVSVASHNRKIVGIELVRPTAHIFYDTRMLDIDDGLGKWNGYEKNSTRIG